MIAWLGMYDPPHVRAVNDRLWAGIRDVLHGHGQEAPQGLDRRDDPWSVWNDADMVLSQTCGLPYRDVLHGRTQLVGTPDYGVDGCPPGYYRSRIIIRADDPRETAAAFHGAALAYNDEASMSGWEAARNWALSRQIMLRPKLRTGGHQQSAEAVAAGRADIAAIDAHTWHLMEQGGARPDGLRVLDHSEPTPGLPMITALGQDVDAIRGAVREAVDGLEPSDRDALGIRALVDIPADSYLARR